MFHLVNVLLYALFWYMNVAWGPRGFAYWIVPATLLCITVQLLYCVYHRVSIWRDLYFVVGATFFGVILEAVLLSYRLVSYATPADYHWLAPNWVLVLYPLFAFTMRHGLFWILCKPGRSVLLGALGAPVVYKTAQVLGAVAIAPGERSLLLLAIFWGLYMLFISALNKTVEGV